MMLLQHDNNNNNNIISTNTEIFATASVLIEEETKWMSSEILY